MINNITFKKNFQTVKQSKLDILKGKNIDLVIFTHDLLERIDKTCWAIREYSQNPLCFNNMSNQIKHNVKSFFTKNNNNIELMPFNNLMEIYRYIPFFIFYEYKMFSWLENKPQNYNNLIKDDILLESAQDFIKYDNCSDKRYNDFNNLYRLKSLMSYSFKKIISINGVKDFYLTIKEHDNFKEIIQIDNIKELDFIRCTISYSYFFRVINNNKDFKSTVCQTLILCKDNYFFTYYDWHWSEKTTKNYLEVLLKIVNKKTLANNLIFIQYENDRINTNIIKQNNFNIQSQNNINKDEEIIKDKIQKKVKK